MRYIKYLLMSAFSFIVCDIIAQTPKDSIDITCLECDSLYNRICYENRGIFGGPDNLAQFPAGDKELMNFIKNTLRYPEECKEKAIQGRVIVKFIIDESGKIICLYVRQSIHPALDKEALRIVKLMPDWKPESTDGIPVKSCFTLPIVFKL